MDNARHTLSNAGHASDNASHPSDNGSRALDIGSHALDNARHPLSVWNIVLQRKTARLFHGGRFFTTKPEDQPRRRSKNSQGHSEPGPVPEWVAQPGGLAEFSPGGNLGWVPEVGRM